MLLSPPPRQRRKSNKTMCACRLNDVNIISIEEQVSMDGKDKLLSIVVDVKYEEDLYYVGRYVGRMLENE